ncbi:MULTISPECIES: flagellar biosynthesis protein FlhF [Pseudoxanthomonas]|uniref:Flagellar biosynthesis protein FlhF n=1 Tax=Pseudoxanthomonas winnipegensis TaxID=2480810 RepID=A0AAW8GCL4_9GAMM|nr:MULTISPECIES: flagellar biosynthesis protein FlhF [Pseudoxanthomonas]MDQ1120164.1 flagellar biosynthesis protein FlhF [Pseudoxanthomonas winnipegensis]MDQ1133375.1 flagellar biosynthesis protein FlhF [Pseudoxanthomonas winnipegensis]MDR6140379.1 flagellar biosynthesis protein FlhF [Pseudoxanthomonas sp. SORGH_AS_0997]
MNIKSFVASDMRTALRMIRDAQGPDAVILSSRPVAGGIEVVSATEYDQAALTRAMRAAGADPADVSPAALSALAQQQLPAGIPASVGIPAQPVAAAQPISAPPPPSAQPDPAAAFAAVMDKARPATHGADSLLARARARLLGQPAEPAPAAESAPVHVTAPDTTAQVDVQDFAAALRARLAESEAQATVTLDMTRPAQPITAAPVAESATPVIEAPTETARPALALVPGIETDPAIVAMREEMARMRALMEAQMEQLSLERLRGSPARAAAFDALTGYGCEQALAQAVALRVDPSLPLAEVSAAMLAELADSLSICASETIDEGGVIALVGPTGAGKTTTAAKLAARFAARHRARDVALITTDCERPGAHEQLQAYGRKLGITVCEARGIGGLQLALEQLADYPLVLVDTTGYAPTDRALFNQILWLRATTKVRSLLVLPANGHAQDMGEVIRRYRPAAPEGLILTKLDETGYLGSALSVAARTAMPIAYTTNGQRIDSDIDAADALSIAQAMESARRSSDVATHGIETRHAVA